jgi:cytoskeleton protein RodZ
VSGFGEKMRREREMRGVSLEEISESTKIGTRSLRALEEEDFEKLPGGIFNKGFVRAYSRFLGLDEEQAVADFDAAWREQQAARGPVPELEPERQPAEPEPSSNRLSLIAAIVLLAIAVVGYALKHYLSARAENVPASNTEVQQVAPSPSDAGQQPESPTRSPISETAVSPNVTPDSKQSKPEPAPTDVATNSNSIPTQKANRTEFSTPSGANAAILLEVTALEDSWLSVSADGKSLGQGILSAQKSRTIRASKEVRLRVGNVAGVEVSFNGKPVNIDGQPKQVKELTFTPDGLQQ